MNPPDYNTLLNGQGNLDDLIIAMGFPVGLMPTVLEVDSRAQDLAQEVMLVFKAGNDRDTILQNLQDICTAAANRVSQASTPAPPVVVPIPPQLAPASPVPAATFTATAPSPQSVPPSFQPAPALLANAGTGIGDPFEHPIIQKARATFKFWKGVVYVLALSPAIAAAFAGYFTLAMIFGVVLSIPFGLFKAFGLDIFEEPKIQKALKPGAYWGINLIVFFWCGIVGAIGNGATGVELFVFVAIILIAFSPATNISHIITGGKSYKLLWDETDFSKTAPVALNVTRFFPGFHARYIDSSVAKQIMKGNHKPPVLVFRDKSRPF